MQGDVVFSFYNGYKKETKTLEHSPAPPTRARATPKSATMLVLPIMITDLSSGTERHDSEREGREKKKRTARRE